MRYVYIAALAGCSALAACGAGGSHANALPTTAPTSAPQSSIRIALTIPAHATLADRRRGLYVSPATASIQFTANPGNVVTDINLTAPVCTTLANGDKACTFSVTAPIGNDTFTVVAYDQQFTGMTLPMGTNALSSASSFTATVVEGAGNVTLPLIMGGVPKTLAFALSNGASTAIFSTGGNAQPLIFTAYDAQGNAIIAPGAFADANGNAAPITLTSANGTSTFGYAVKSAATGITGAAGATIAFARPDDTASLVWTGGYVPPSDTVTLPGGLTIHGSGLTTTSFSFGYRFTPLLAPSLLAPMDAGIAAASGHKGIVTAAPPEPTWIRRRRQQNVYDRRDIQQPGRRHAGSRSRRGIRTPTSRPTIRSERSISCKSQSHR